MDHDGGGHGHGVPSFQDIFLGLEAAATFTGHSLSLADAAAASIFIEAALDHGGGFEFSDFPTGYTQDVPALQGAGLQGPDGPAYGDSGRELNLPGIARSAARVETLYWPHGRCEPRQQIPHLAARAGLERYRPIYHPTWAETVQTEPRILSGLPFGAPDERRKLPNGWYQGARGVTHYWREFYRVQGGRGLLFRRPDSYEAHRTFLIVTGAMWHYHHIPEYWLNDDYETRVAFSIYSQPSWNGAAWTYNAEQVRRHRRAAERLAKLLHDYLGAHPPSSNSVGYRRAMNPALTRPAPPA